MTFPGSFPVDLPGVTLAWLAKANECSLSTLKRTISPESERSSEESTRVVSEMTSEVALQLAWMRPSRGMLPYWSRLAIADLASRGATYAELMVLFGVGRSTVYRAVHKASAGYVALSGVRALTASQKAVGRGNAGSG